MAKKTLSESSKLNNIVHAYELAHRGVKEPKGYEDTQKESDDTSLEIRGMESNNPSAKSRARRAKLRSELDEVEKEE